MMNDTIANDGTAAIIMRNDDDDDDVVGMCRRCLIFCWWTSLRDHRRVRFEIVQRRARTGTPNLRIFMSSCRYSTWRRGP